MMKFTKKAAALSAVLFLALAGCSSADTADVKTSKAEEDKAAVELKDLKPVTKDDVDIQYDQYYDDTNLNLEITNGLDAVKSVHFLLFLEEGAADETDADKFIYLGEDNNMEGDYDTGKFKDNFNGYWTTIGGTLVTLEVIEEEEAYTLYSVPCIIDGEETSIRAMYTYSSGTYKILGRYDGIASDSGSHATSRGVRKINEGAQVVFTLSSLEGENLDEYEYQMDPITWSNDVVMQDEDMGDGTFLYMYEIEDVFGNEIDVDPVEVQVTGDDIQWLTELE